METRLECGAYGFAAAERLDVPPQLGEGVRQLCQIFLLQLAVGLVLQIVAHDIRKRSCASLAAATNAGAVLQWPRISLPLREARTALRSSTTRMTGIPGQEWPSVATWSTGAKPSSTGAVAQSW